MTITVTTESFEPTITTEKQLHIVMVDDDRSEHALLVMAAQEAGVRADFEFYEDGAELLLHLNGRTKDDLPDVLVLDLRMPGLDGHRTLDELQLDPVLCQIPVVVFTSSPRPVDRRESLDRGAVSYTLKPSDFEGMVNFARGLAEPAEVPTIAPAEARIAEARARRDGCEAIHDEVDDYLKRNGYLEG